MASGEFTSVSAIYATTPDFCPWPIAWGTYESMPDVDFFLREFHQMTNEIPDLHSFPAKMAALHREGTSPGGKYDFSCTTHHGNTPLDHGWTGKWKNISQAERKSSSRWNRKCKAPMTRSCSSPRHSLRKSSHISCAHWKPGLAVSSHNSCMEICGMATRLRMPTELSQSSTMLLASMLTTNVGEKVR